MKISKDILVILILMITAFASFGLGRLSVANTAKNTISFDQAPQLPSVTGVNSAPISADSSEQISNSNQIATVVASKNGTKYHFPWCSGAQRIKESNIIQFASIADAKEAGYTPAANCKGLE